MIKLQDEMLLDIEKGVDRLLNQVEDIYSAFLLLNIIQYTYNIFVV